MGNQKRPNSCTQELCPKVRRKRRKNSASFPGTSRDPNAKYGYYTPNIPSRLVKDEEPSTSSSSSSSGSSESSTNTVVMHSDSSSDSFEPYNILKQPRI